MSLESYNPLDDPDAQVCPVGCGWLTDDPYGGPCTDCLAELGAGDRPLRHFSAQRVCDADCLDATPPSARPVRTAAIVGDLL
jgi:hypothetical protein